MSRAPLTDSPDDELPSGPVTAERRDLNDNSDDENDRADKDHPPPAETIAVHQGKDGAGQTANLVNRCSRKTSQLDDSARVRCPETCRHRAPVGPKLYGESRRQRDCYKWRFLKY